MAKLTGLFGFRSVVLAGITAGLSLAAFEVLATAALTGTGTAGQPLREIAALILGPGALDPGYSAALAGTVGLAVDLSMAVLFAIIFAAIVSPVHDATHGELLNGAPGLILVGVIFGTVLWLVNFYVIGRVAGWTWLTSRMNHDVAFLGHAFFFGGTLGWLLARTPALREHAA